LFRPLEIKAVDRSVLTQALKAMGCPSEKSSEMAAQLEKRAEQLARERQQSVDEALVYLLGLMKQGWAAQGKGL
jgi:hypothetical protein